MSTVTLDRALLVAMFQAAVRAADPEVIVPPNLPERPKGKVIVLGLGKAAARMARAVENAWDVPLTGAVVTSYGNAVPCKQIRVFEAAHPIPDAAGLRAAQVLIDHARAARPDDLILALISGGGSALLPAPIAPLTLDDEIALNRALLASGAPISVMNVLRGQISRIKSGRLAGFAPRTPIVNLVISDVPGDDPGEVASGPTIPRQLSARHALDLARDWQIVLPAVIEQFLNETIDDVTTLETGRISTKIIASARMSLESSANVAHEHGVMPVILSDRIEGESRDIGRMHAALAREVAERNHPFSRPVVLLSGGETTVTLRGKGRGGRNGELALSFGLDCDGLALQALFADTDGRDGSETNAGVFVSGQTAASLRKLGLNGRAMLADNDSYTAFSALGDLFDTGPTGTNVNDFRAILLR